MDLGVGEELRPWQWAGNTQKIRGEPGLSAEGQGATLPAARAGENTLRKGLPPATRNPD